MLTADQQFVLSLLRVSLTDAERPVVSQGLDVRAMGSAIRRNGILPTVYQSLGIFPDLQQRLRMYYYASVGQSVNQGHSGQQVLKALGEAGLRCVPLKGWEMRKLYPNPTMREMTDLDLLVRPYKYDDVEEIMRSLGFVPEGGESSEKHDVYRMGMVTVEVHKRLTDDGGAIRAWEARMWDRVSADSDGYVHMSDEDQYVFHFVHMHHDFGNGWFGLRRIVDTWLLDQRWDQIDAEYVMRELDSMGFADFHARMTRLGRVCMGEEPLDEDAELLLQHAYDCGIYGNGTSYKAGRIATLTNGGAATGKVCSIIAALFMPYGRMKAYYPILEKWPVLLPAFWAKRIASFLRSGRFRQYESMLDYRGITDEDVAHARKVLRAGGY